MKTERFLAVLETLQGEYPKWDAPVVTLIAQHSGDPFRVLISTILSLRTKDETTAEASKRLFALADTPQKMVQLPPETIEQAIFPVGFYRNKAAQVLAICRTLIDTYAGQVPDRLDALMAFKGVGLKTANLVLALGYQIPAICVDIHVHRICNRLGFIRTKTPEESEARLRRKVPQTHWLIINDLMVAFGQSLCRPVSPHCSRCPVAHLCERKGITKSR
jgi:endonuclease-3